MSPLAYVSLPKHSRPTPDRKTAAGFTLLELVIVIVLMGILAVSAVFYSLDPAELTLPTQAERLASDIRLAQTLAYTSGNQVSVAGTGTSYTTSPCSSPCTTATVTFQQDISLQGSPSVTFRTNGQPTAAASFVLQRGGSSSTKTVTISAEGNITITPP